MAVTKLTDDSTVAATFKPAALTGTLPDGTTVEQENPGWFRRHPEATAIMVLLGVGLTIFLSVYLGKNHADWFSGAWKDSVTWIQGAWDSAGNWFKGAWFTTEHAVTGFVNSAVGHYVLGVASGVAALASSIIIYKIATHKRPPSTTSTSGTTTTTPLSTSTPPPAQKDDVGIISLFNSDDEN